MGAAKLGVGVVGYGYWGPNLVRNFDQLANLVACCDLEQSNLKKIKEAYPQVEGSQDWRDVIDHPRVEAVVIATSAHTHYELAKAALLQDKHVFVEKPLALSSGHASELTNLAEDKAKTLMVGHLLVYHPAVKAIRSYLETGLIGKTRYLYSQRLNLGKVRRDENALWSLAPHDISVILHVMGGVSPDEVSCRGESYLRDGVQDVVFCSLHFPDKVLAHLHVSWLDPHKIRKLTIVGDKKMVVFDDMESTEKIRVYDKGVEGPSEYRRYGEDLTLRFGEILIPPVVMKEPLRLECQHFIDCVVGGQKPVSGGPEGLRVVQVLEAAQKSMENRGAPVPITDAANSAVRAGYAEAASLSAQEESEETRQ